MNELVSLYELPLLTLISTAMKVHSEHHEWDKIQKCVLISVKTGGCPMDCRYCAQSSYYQTGIKAQPMMSYEEVMEKGKVAVQHGATRICLGMAQKEMREGKQFEELLKMVKGLASLHVEVCVTLGKITELQALKLKEAGLFAYNHNLDSSSSFYKIIVTTRKYEERLETIDTVQDSDIHLCSGGILGMGETFTDRLELLHTLHQREPHPQSIPINKLVPIKGTPLEHQKSLPIWEIVRIIAIARIICPKSKIRLGAGRESLTFEEQALCFMAGANSLFLGAMLTAPGTPEDLDKKMFQLFGLNR